MNNNSFTNHDEILGMLKEAASKRKEADPEPVPKPEPSDGQLPVTMVGLDGIQVSGTGEMSRVSYFEKMRFDKGKYADVQFTQEQAMAVSASMRRLTTGINAAVPLICKGVECPFEATCVYVEIDQIPLARPCHPPGTMIRTVEDGYVAIEQLNDESDRVVSVEPGIGRGDVSLQIGGQDFTLGSRHYSGDLFKIKVGEDEHECTDSHVCITQWSPEASKCYITYIMQAGGFTHRGVATLGEDAGDECLSIASIYNMSNDAKIWITGYFETHHEAIHEGCSGTAAQHLLDIDLPAPHMMQDECNARMMVLRRSAIGNCHLDEVLESYGLRYDYPFIASQKDLVKLDTKSNRVEIEACNVASEYMMGFHTQTAASHALISDRIQVSRRPYSGPVYSLGVDNEPRYLANGIATHNCLVESQLIEYWTEQFIEEFDVSIESFTEMHLVSELAELNIYELRATKNLALNNATLLQTVVAGVDVSGNVLENEGIAKSFELKERIKKTRMKILDALMATRKERAKLAPPEDKEGPTSTKFTELKNKLDEYMRNAKEASIVDAEVVPSGPR